MMFALGLVALGVEACAATAEPPGVLSNQDLSALRTIAERDAPLVRARNWAALSSGYTEDAVRMPPNSPAIRGRDAIRASLEQMPPISAFDYRLVDLQGDGRIAYMQGAWSITVGPSGVPHAVSDSGKILIVLRKQADGTWLRAADAWNSDLATAR
jgi:ketosteroid isomerase-like protein